MIKMCKFTLYHIYLAGSFTKHQNNMPILLGNLVKLLTLHNSFYKLMKRFIFCFYILLLEEKYFITHK